MYTVPPSYLYDSTVDTISRPSLSLHVPAERRVENGKLVVMLEQQWYTLIRPWIARYMRLQRRYRNLPIVISLSWTPDISFTFPAGTAAINLSAVAHLILERKASIGCIADPITIAVDRETGTGEIVEGNGVLMSRNERTDAT